MDLGLKGKVAIVGGSSQGIGFAIARTLAAEGASVTLTARRAQDLEQAARAAAGVQYPGIEAHSGPAQPGVIIRHAELQGQETPEPTPACQAIVRPQAPGERADPVLP